MLQMKHWWHICFWEFTSYKRRNGFTNLPSNSRTLPATQDWAWHLNMMGSILLDVVGYISSCVEGDHWPLNRRRNHPRFANMDEPGGGCGAQLSDTCGIQMTSDQPRLCASQWFHASCYTGRILRLPPRELQGLWNPASDRGLEDVIAAEGVKRKSPSPTEDEPIVFSPTLTWTSCNEAGKQYVGQTEIKISGGDQDQVQSDMFRSEVAFGSKIGSIETPGLFTKGVPVSIGHYKDPDRIPSWTNQDIMEMTPMFLIGGYVPLNLL